MLSPRYGTAKILLIAKVLINEVVFTADEDTARAITAPGNTDEQIGRVLKGLTVLTNNMVKAEI